MCERERGRERIFCVCVFHRRQDYHVPPSQLWHWTGVTVTRSADNKYSPLIGCRWSTYKALKIIQNGPLGGVCQKERGEICIWGSTCDDDSDQYVYMRSIIECDDSLSMCGAIDHMSITCIHVADKSMFIMGVQIAWGG